MGMSLVGVGFTVDTERECKTDEVIRFIHGLADEEFDDELLGMIDPSGGYLEDADQAREALKSGAQEFSSARDGHRSTMYYTIPGTHLVFVWAGGGTWGDDPFDGFTDLCIFVEYAAVSKQVADLAGFVSGGLPHVDTIKKHLIEGETNG